MNPSFHIIDFVIVGIYAILLVGVGLWVSRTKKGHTKTAEDYFLASKALPWWAIGSSLIAANISAIYRYVRFRFCRRSGYCFL